MTQGLSFLKGNLTEIKDKAGPESKLRFIGVWELNFVRRFTGQIDGTAPSVPTRQYMLNKSFSSSCIYARKNKPTKKSFQVPKQD